MSTKLKPCSCGYEGELIGMQHNGFLSMTCPKCSRRSEAFTLEGLADRWNKSSIPTSHQDQVGAEEKQTTSPTVDQIMDQAQVFASAWSLVGGPFDSGDQLEQAKQEEEELRRMVVALLINQEAGQ